MATVNVVIRQRGVSASEAEVRGHKIVMDRPEAKGGENSGMMGGETILSGLGGCFLSNLLAAAMARDIELNDTKVEISAEVEDGPPRFTAISMKVSAVYPDGTEFDKLVLLAERGCIAANTLRNAVKLEILPG